MGFIGLVKNAAYNIKDSYRSIRRTDSNILVFIVYGLLYDMVINLYKPFALKFLDRMGGAAIHISLYNSLPGFVAMFALLPGTILVGKFQKKKRVTTVFFSIGRSLILSLAVIPFMPSAFRPMAFVLFIAVINFFDAVSQCSLQSFLGETFNGFTRAKAISLRNKFGVFFTLLITMLTGVAITYIPKTDGQRIFLYQLFFILAFTIGVFEIITFNKFKTKKTAEPGQDGEGFEKATWRAAAATLKDKKFMKYLLITMCFNFAWYVGWPLSGIFQIKSLNSNELWLALVVVASGIGSFFTASYWPKIINKKGNDFAIFIASVGLALNMLLSAVCPNLIVFALINVMAGAASTGYNITILNGLLIATPDKHRVIFIGVYNTFANALLAASPLLSYYMYSVTGVRWSMAVTGFLRVIAGAVLLIHYFRLKKKGGAEAPA